LRNFGLQIAHVLTNGRTLWMVVMGCIFFSFAGPFGSFSDLTVSERALFWGPVFLGSFLTKAITHSFVVTIFHHRPLAQRRTIDFFIFSGVFSPVLFAFLNAGPVAWRADDISFAILSSWVLLTAGTCTALFSIINPEEVITIVHEGPIEEAPLPPRLFRRLGLCSEEFAVTRLTVNDHYVLVGLSDGSEQRLLMRLSDAILEMDDVLGYITHRSHWVSQSHVKGVVTVGKREMLELTTGVKVPISRTYRPVLAAAGLFEEVAQSPERQLVP
jgi:hypothetical protein